MKRSLQSIQGTEQWNVNIENSPPIPTPCPDLNILDQPLHFVNPPPRQDPRPTRQTHQRLAPIRPASDVHQESTVAERARFSDLVSRQGRSCRRRGELFSDRASRWGRTAVDEIALLVTELLRGQRLEHCRVVVQDFDQFVGGDAVGKRS